MGKAPLKKHWMCAGGHIIGTDAQSDNIIMIMVASNDYTSTRSRFALLVGYQEVVPWVC